MSSSSVRRPDGELAVRSAPRPPARCRLDGSRDARRRRDRGNAARSRRNSPTWPSSSLRPSRTGKDPAGARCRRGRLSAQGRRARRARKAIESAARGDAPLDPRAARALLGARRAAAPAEGLSDREREVLVLVAEGLPNKLIARRLDISEKTVKAHLTSIFRQIGVTDRTQAALWAERNGITGRQS